MERIEPFRTLLEPVWNEARKARFEIISSEIIVVETLVKPFRGGRAWIVGCKWWGSCQAMAITVSASPAANALM